MTTAREAFRHALDAFSRGRIDDAGRLCDEALALDGQDAGALHLAAVIALTRQRPDIALERVDAAIAIDPRDSRQYQTRGQAHLAIGKTDSAESDFRKAIEIAPDFPDAHASLGARLVALGKFTEAREHLSRALAIRPRAAQWQYNLALCESSLGHREVAERLLEEALRDKPGWAPALIELASLLIQRGAFAAAVPHLEAALRADPRLNAAWNQLGVARLSLGNVDGALEALAHAIEIDPSDADAWTNIGNAKRRACDRAGAAQSFEKALDHRPGFAIALRNLGNIQRESGRFEDSVDTLERCIAMSAEPVAHWSLSLTLLTKGELARGWQEYRWRDNATPDQELRDGVREAVGNRRPIELVGEQGLGDVLFFLRWLPLLGADPGTITLRCDRRLHALLATSGFAGRLVDAKSAPVGNGITVRVGDLPALLWGQGEDHPPPMPLKADGAALETARRTLQQAGPPPYVAIAWRAGLPPSASEEHLVKAVPPDQLGTALRDIPATLVSVQRNPREDEMNALSEALGKPVADASGFNDDLVRITGIMAAVDAYAGVSNTNVHLGAGLGLAADILVPFPPEWRYGTGGSVSPWYPGFTLHREGADGNWVAALESLHQSVRSKLEAHR